MNIINPYRFAGGVAFDGFGNASRSFDGTNDFVRIPDPDESNTSLTVMCWVKTSATSDASVVMGHQDVNSNNRSWVITMSKSGNGSGTKFRVVLDELGTGKSVSQKDYWATTGTISDGTWHHCAFSWDSGTLKLFVDGVEQSVTKDLDASFTSIFNSAGKMSLACVLSLNTGLAITAAKLADVRLYDAVLTESQITSIYNGINNTTDLIGWWLDDDDDLNDNAGTNDGTNVGSTYDTDGPAD